MHHFTAHRLIIRGTVAQPLLLNEHKGSALRGALYHNLRNRFCSLRDQVPDCTTCPLAAVCPVCTLVSTMGPDNRLGRDAARPYTIQPPLPSLFLSTDYGEQPWQRWDDLKTRYEAGEPFHFGLTLYGDALRLFPYVVMAIQGLEEAGLGRAVPENAWRRGTIHLEEIRAQNPLTGETALVSRAGEPMVQMPDIPITHEQVLAHSRQLEGYRELTLTLLTPTRLTHRQRLVKPRGLTLAILLGRLLDRLESLAQHFAATPHEGTQRSALNYAALVAQARKGRTAQNETFWVELRSYSTRQRRATPIGGLVGRVTFVAEDWAPFLPWLIWGQFTHVGKDAVKGNGWYRLEEA